MGTLFIVPTPIGNMKDITLRSLETLEYVDWIACEDTRRTLKLLNAFNIKKKLFSYHEHTLYKNGQLIEKLKEGFSGALVSDAGMPVIADSGVELIRDCRNEGISVEVLPGASAVMTALVNSGFPVQNFIYVNFFPRKKGKFIQLLEKTKNTGYSVCAFESPHRIVKTLSWFVEFDSTIEICICREMTKMHEEIVWGKASELYEKFLDRDVKGEISLVYRFIAGENNE
ncbi:MAG: 16S rRNA (cytidine(1402)-2'-O)-methyltransferase [Caldisericia bacterium]|nr:16S rRNA (cytidine(1402)-2'-O)-methyltransferase [Caldisericia bacterium]